MGKTQEEDKMTEEVSKLLVWLLIVPAAFIGMMLVGHGIMTVLFRTIRPLEKWADKQIADCESRWDREDEEE